MTTAPRPPGPRARCWILAAALLGTAVTPAPSLAHPLLDQAKGQAERAEFERALLTLAKAESEAVLTRDDVVELYLQRAMIHFALRLTSAMAADLELVATLEPKLALDPGLPPEVRAAFPTRAEQLALRVDGESRPQSVRLHLQVFGLRTDLVRGVKLSARPRGGEWISGETSELEIGAQPGEPVEYYAVAYGPGGAELITLGSWSEPRSLTPAPVGALQADEESSDVGWWIAGGVAVAAVAATVGILLATSSETTQLSAPMIER